jgi:uncharacterized protein (TIGR02996 family)
MSVFFVYRSLYNSPLEKHVRRFDDDSVVAWARRVWGPVASDRAFDRGKELLGGLEVYSFGSLFDAEREALSGPPEDMDQVAGWFGNMYCDEVLHGPHHLQVFTDDDETEMAIYLFDDHYRAANPGKTDFLLHEGWELPAGGGDGPVLALPGTHPIGPTGDEEGILYLIGLVAFDSCNLTDLGGSSGRLDGLRLDGLCRFLLLHPDEDGLGAGVETARDALQVLLANPVGEDAGFLLALRDEPGEWAHWNAYSDWLHERDRPVAGLHLLEHALREAEATQGRKNRDPARDLIRVTYHLAQATKHEGRWPDGDFLWFTPHDTYETHIYFDDRWAMAHPSLAEGMVCFNSRWDVL